MKLTKTYLTQLIKEEIEHLFEMDTDGDGLFEPDEVKAVLKNVVDELEEDYPEEEDVGWRPKPPSAAERRSAKAYVIQNSDGSFVEGDEGVVFYEDEGEATEDMDPEQEVKLAYLARDLPSKAAWMDWRIPKGDPDAKWKVVRVHKEFETSTELPPPPRGGRSKRHTQYRKMGLGK